MFEYSYDYTAKGAVIPYCLTLERYDRPANAQPVTGKTLSAKVGNNIGTALSAITSAVGDTAQTVNSFTAQLQTVIGQVTPLANLIGIDGPFTAAQNAFGLRRNAGREPRTRYLHVPEVSHRHWRNQSPRTV